MLFCWYNLIYVLISLVYFFNFNLVVQVNSNSMSMTCEIMFLSAALCPEPCPDPCATSTMSTTTCPPCEQCGTMLPDCTCQCPDGWWGKNCQGLFWWIVTLWFCNSIKTYITVYCRVCACKVNLDFILYY